MILAAAQDATPSGAPDPDLVTPGTIGFVVTLVIVIVIIFLIRDALKRVRRLRARTHADDAYPIPMRKYAVPNQSKLSGESAPAADEESATTVGAEDSETEQSDPEQADPGQTGAEQTDSGPIAAEQTDAGPNDANQSDSGPTDTDQTGTARSQD